MTTLTQDRLKSVLDYCPDLGLFWFKPRPGNQRFNTRYAGELAGSLNNGYVHVQVDGRRYKAHRLAWLWMTGKMPEGELDHANRYRMDNAFANLREATGSQNLANRAARSRSGKKGVYLLPSGRYSAHFRREYLGSFDTADEASDAYMARAKSYWGPFAQR